MPAKRYYYLLLLILCLSCADDDPNPYSEDHIEELITNSLSEEYNDTGERIGGGVNGHKYSKVYTEGDFMVDSRDGLLKALGSAKKGEIIFIKRESVLDLTGEQNLKIPDGVTLASDRGFENSLGALLFTRDLATPSLFLIEGKDIRITGIRINGPDDETRNSAYDVPNSQGIKCYGAKNIEIDNCEIAAWSHAGIALYANSNNINIHHNYIHHCRRVGLGYGIVHDLSKSLIEANLFNFNRETIAGTGVAGTSYIARLNICLPNDAYTHNFDMHGCIESPDCPPNLLYSAGDSISISLNTFYNESVPAIKIRGTANSGVWVSGNWFLHDSTSQAIICNNNKCFVKNNYYGEKRYYKK